MGGKQLTVDAATSGGHEFRRGWRILLASTIGVAMGVSALPFYTAGVFVVPLEAAFGWTRAEISWGALVSTLTVAVASPFVGAAVDRFGVRGPGFASLLMLGVGFMLLATMQGALAAFIGIQIAMALLGAASTPLSFTRAINAWFDHAKGLALGLTLAGMGLTAAFAPRLIFGVIENESWRTGYVVLGAAAILSAPLVWWLLGRQGDAMPRPSFVGKNTSSRATPFRNPVFWRLAIAFALLSAAVAGFVLHFVPMLTDAGVSPARAAAIQGLLGFAVLGGRVVTGALIDRFFAPRVAALLITLSAAGVAVLALGDIGLAPVAAIALGFALGAEVDLIGYLTARYFGMAAYGRIYGVLYAAFIAGAGTSPVVIATIASTGGGYAAALWTSAATLLVVAVLLGTAPAFPKSESAK